VPEQEYCLSFYAKLAAELFDQLKIVASFMDAGAVEGCLVASR
jgi:hypothetical protein